MPLQIRRGTRADREDLVTSYVPLATGEPLWCTDTGDLFIGDGVTPGGVQVNEESLIDLSEYTGLIGPDSFINVGQKRIDLDGTVQTSIVPQTNENLNLGANELRFNKIWVGGNGIAIGESIIVNNGTAIQLPFDSTVGGQPIATGQGITPGNTYTISIAADDSTVIVDHTTSTFTGTLRGNVTDLSGSTIINAGTKIGTFNEIVLTTQSQITGNPVFLSNLTSFIALAPSAIEPLVSFTAITDTAGTGGSIALTRSRGTNPLSPQIVQNGDEVGSVEFSAYNGAGFEAAGGFVATVDGIPSINQPTPIKIDIKVSDGSTIITATTIKPDRIEIIVPIVMPKLTTTERGLITPAVGMIIYNTTDNKFQGYQITGGTTPEWVNLS